MSHFSVLVFGKNPEKQLAPYHEFECTGINDKYVKNINVTKEHKRDFKKDTKRMLVDQNGNMFSAYDDQFYREITPEEQKKHHPMGTGCGGGISWSSRDWNDGKGYRTKVHYIPEGFTEKQVPISETMTFREYIEDYNGICVVPFGTKPIIDDDAGDAPHKYGYAIEDKDGNITKVVRRTNPNRKWDWYQLGGRSTGRLKFKESTIGLIGEKSLVSSRTSKQGYGDQTIKSNIDIEAMRNEAAKAAGEQYDKIMKLVKGTPVNESWESVRRRWTKDDTDYTDIDKARDEYHKQPRVVAFSKNRDSIFDSVDEYNIPREQYVNNARNNALTTFAMVKDGKWYERGKMGWWAVVTDEKDGNEWTNELNKLFDEVPDDTLISIYDCHI